MREQGSLDGWRVRLRAAIDRTYKKHSFIAEQAGIAPETLSRILSGRTNPSFETVVRLTYATGETISSLLGERAAVEFTRAEKDTIRRASDLLRRAFSE